MRIGLFLGGNTAPGESLSLGTLDMNATRAFYEGVLGFKAVRCDIIKVKEGGEIRHVFFDTGKGQLGVW